MGWVIDEEFILQERSEDVHAVTGLLKQFLRDLPEPLLTFSLHQQWLSFAEKIESTEKQGGWFGFIADTTKLTLS